MSDSALIGISGGWSKDPQYLFPHKLSYNLKNPVFFSSEPGGDQSRQSLLSFALLTCPHFIGVVLSFTLHTLDVFLQIKDFFFSSLLPYFPLLSYFSYDVSHLSVLNFQFFCSYNPPFAE